jgi:hypothetical protein
MNLTLSVAIGHSHIHQLRAVYAFEPYVTLQLL